MSTEVPKRSDVEKLLVFCYQSRMTADLMYMDMGNGDALYTARLRPWKQPANENVMYIGSGATLYDAMHSVFDHLRAGKPLPLVWAARTAAEAKTGGRSGLVLPQLPF